MLLKRRNNYAFNGSGQHGAANNNGVARGLGLHRRADLFADAPDMTEIQATIRIARRAYANQRNLSVANRVAGTSDSAQPARGNHLGYQIFEPVFHNWTLPGVNDSDFGRIKIDADYVVPRFREARR